MALRIYTVERGVVQKGAWVERGPKGGAVLVVGGREYPVELREGSKVELERDGRVLVKAVEEVCEKKEGRGLVLVGFEEAREENVWMGVLLLIANGGAVEELRVIWDKRIVVVEYGDGEQWGYKNRRGRLEVKKYKRSARHVDVRF